VRELRGSATCSITHRTMLPGDYITQDVGELYLQRAISHIGQCCQVTTLLKMNFRFMVPYIVNDNFE